MDRAPGRGPSSRGTTHPRVTNQGGGGGWIVPPDVGRLPAARRESAAGAAHSIRGGRLSPTHLPLILRSSISKSNTWFGPITGGLPPGP